MTQTYDVVVVGAGPVGLSLALGLARAGREVLVLEKDASTVERSRAPAIWPRTQEILAGLGVIDSFRERALRLHRVALWHVERQREILSLPLHELDDATAYPEFLLLPQSETEQLLYDALRRQPTARVNFCCTAKTMLQGSDIVRVSWEGPNAGVAQGRYAAGCDGAHSTVRSAMGASFDGETYATHAALVDIRLSGHSQLPFPRVSTRGSLSLAIRMNGDDWRLILTEVGSDEHPLGEVVDSTMRRLFPSVTSSRSYEVLWKSEFSLHRKLSSRFVEGRIALAGDAAHLNSPVGGQGMNAGIQDAHRLTALMLEALNSSNPSRLMTYDRRRAEIKKGVNAFTDQATRLLLGRSGKATERALRVLSAALHVPPLRRRLLHRVSMLDARHD